MLLPEQIPAPVLLLLAAYTFPHMRVSQLLSVNLLFLNLFGAVQIKHLFDLLCLRQIPSLSDSGLDPTAALGRNQKRKLWVCVQANSHWGEESLHRFQASGPPHTGTHWYGRHTLAASMQESSFDENIKKTVLDGSSWRSALETLPETLH